MSAKGLKVTITTQFGVPFTSYPEAAPADANANKTTTYILAPPAGELQTKPFEIHIKAEPWLVFQPGVGYQFMLFLKKNQLLQTCWLDSTHREGVMPDQVVREVGGGWGSRDFVFQELKISDEEGLKALPLDVASSIGLVEVVVKRVYNPAANHTHQTMFYGSGSSTTFFDNSREHAAGGLSSTIHEKALKGNDARHQATLGNSRPSAEPPVGPPFRYYDKEPYHTFYFLYRPKSVLESLNILPVSIRPTSIPNSLFAEPRSHPSRLAQTAAWINTQQNLSNRRGRTLRDQSEDIIIIDTDSPRISIKTERGGSRNVRDSSVADGYEGTERKRKSKWYTFSEEKRWKDSEGELEEIAPPRVSAPVRVVLDDD